MLPTLASHLADASTDLPRTSSLIFGTSLWPVDGGPDLIASGRLGVLGVPQQR